MRLIPLASALLLAGALALPAAAQSTPITTEVVATGFNRPLAVACPPDGSGRLFVVEQNQSDVHVIDGGVVLPTPYLDLTGKTKTSGNEQGLLGFAFHPDYANNGYVYVDYTMSGNTTVIERYSVDPGDPNVALPGSVLPILTIAQPQTNHNAGNLFFGPDGMLWIATGDGGNFNDQGGGHVAGGNAQSGTTLLGKMLRIDVDNPSGGKNYGIPADNPYVGDPSVMDEIWAFGLRNPWRYSFDRDTGDLWIGDVGQDPVNAVGREEIDYIPAATIAAVNAGSLPPLNFGWRCQEGLVCTGLSGCTCPSAALTDPIKQWNQSNARAIIGGFVYRGKAIPDLDGTYFYADNSFSRVWSLRQSGGVIVPGTDQLITSQLDPPGTVSISSPSSWGEDEDGELYLCNFGMGAILKVVPDAPFVGLGGNLAGTVGEPILFGTGDTALGQPGALHLRNAVPNAPLAVLFLSLGSTPTPFKGGTLFTIPLLAQFNLFTDPTGGLDIPWTDLGVTGPVSAFWQWAIPDGGAPFGVALSNALRMDIP